jgi:hypothetical protein
MPLFNESLESIAQAVVTVKRALKAEAIEKKDYKGLSNYLAKRAKDFKIKKADLTRANEDLDAELESEVEEFFMEEDEALAKMAEELLEEYEGDKPAAEAAEDDWDKQAAAAWAKMNNEERAAMAVLASNWQKSR